MSGTIVDELGRIPMSPNLAAALHRASSYAQAQAHREVTLEHLLLALTEDPDAGQVLEASRIDLHRLHGDVSSHIGRIEDRNPADLTGHISVSAELRRILEAAAAAALKGRRREINGAIVLAAIVGDGRTIAAHMLRAQGLTFEEAIRVLQRAPAPQPAPKVPGPPPPSPSMRQAPPPAPPEPPIPPPQAHTPPPQAHMYAPGQQRPSAEDVITSARERVQRNWVEPAPPRRPEPEFDQQPSFDEPEAAQPPPSQSFEPRFEPAFPQSPDAQPLEMEPEPDEAPVQGLEPQHPYGLAPPPPPPVSAPVEYASPPPPPAPQPAGAVEPASETSQLHQPAATPPAPPPPQRFPTSWAPPPQPPPHSPAAPALRPNRPPPPLPPAIPDMPVPPDPRMLDPRLAGWPPHAPPHGPSPQIGPQNAPQIAPPPRDPQGAGFAVPPPGFGPRDSGPPPQMPPPQPPPAPWQEPARRAEPQFEPPPPPPQAQRGPFPHVPPAQPPPYQPPPMSPPEDDFDPEVPPSRGGPAQRAEPRFEQPKRVGAIELGQLIENIGAKMRVGVPQTVEVRIAKADVRAFAEATGQELLVTKAVAMRLRATDHGFFVETAAPETQWIENTAGGMMSDDYASWRWTVTPRKRGKRRRLLLVVAARAVGGDGAAAEAALPERAYEVRVRGNVGQALKRWIGWGVAAVVGGLLVKFGDQIVPVAMKLVQALMAGPQP